MFVQKVNEIYQHANQGEKFDFDLTKKAKQIQVLNAELNNHEWIVTITRNSEKVMPTISFIIRSFAHTLYTR